jgi:DNA repair ATPase RecN
VKKTLLAATTLALAAGSVAAGCGGGNDTTTTEQAALSKGAFAAQANEICRKGNQDLRQAGQKFFKSLNLSGNERPTAEQVQRFAAQTAIPNIQAQITAVEALPAPAGDEDQVKAITDSAQQALDKLKQDPSLLQSNDDPFAEANRLAKQYGLDQCAGG